MIVVQPIASKLLFCFKNVKVCLCWEWQDNYIADKAISITIQTNSYQVPLSTVEK